MFIEDDLLPISGLQHLAFCPRQCALIHIECSWEENRLSAEGRLFHDRVHDGSSGMEDGRLIVRSLRLVSRTLGLYGMADVVEFHNMEEGFPLKGRKGRWKPFPIEYKRGRPKKDNEDRVQLCAQAICLEERFGIEIPEGALFYGRTRRREDVVFTDTLRNETGSFAKEFHEMVKRGSMPTARKSKKCDNCSLVEICMPGAKRDARRYIRDMLRLGCEEER